MGRTLFEIHTDLVSLVWGQTKRSSRPTGLPSSQPHRFGLHVRSATSHDKTNVDVVSSDEQGYLFEQTDYSVFVKSNTNAPVQLWHRDPLVRNRLHYTHSATIGHGIINFGSQIGTSRFVVEHAGVPAIIFEVEIVPSKLDYQNDYVALRDDLEEMVWGLVGTYLRATYHQGTYATPAQATSLAWLQILEHIFDDLLKACRFIREHPRQQTTQTPSWVPITRIKRRTSAVQHAIQTGKGSGARMASALGYGVRASLLAPMPRYTSHTPEHEWLAFTLRQVESRLTGLLTDIEQNAYTARRKAIAEHLSKLQLSIQFVLKKAPFADLPPISKPPAPSMALQGAPGYREAYRACLALRQGLSVKGHVIETSIKDLHLLYEYWCYLTVARLLAEITETDLSQTPLLATHETGFDLQLKKGKHQRLLFRYNDHQTVECIYNPRFGGVGYVVPQQPDIAITIRSPQHPVRRYILDAKYRLDSSAGYVRRYRTPGPPTESLNALHRYRDAILDEDTQESTSQRTVWQAVALFPYREPHDSAFAHSKLWHALQDVGVGAIPVLPHATAYLASWLQEILDT